VVERFQAQLMMLEMGERALFTAGYDAVLHVHCCDEEVTVEKVCVCLAFVALVPPFTPLPPSLVHPLVVLLSCPLHAVQLVHELDKKTGEVKPGVPRFVREGALVVAQLKTARSVCVETFDDMQQLGRFTLRDAGVYPHARLPRWRGCGGGGRQRVVHRWLSGLACVGAHGARPHPTPWLPSIVPPPSFVVSLQDAPLPLARSPSCHVPLVRPALGLPRVVAALPAQQRLRVARVRVRVQVVLAGPAKEVGRTSSRPHPLSHPTPSLGSGHCPFPSAPRPRVFALGMHSWFRVAVAPRCLD
jgi:hypothetical protein